MTKQKKKIEEDKIMTKEDKRKMVARLEERSFEVQNITKNWLNTMSQLLIANQELKKKDMEITNLRLQSDQLRSELRSEKEILERMNKPSEDIKYFEELMRSPRSSSNTSGLGHIKYELHLLKKENHPRVERKEMQNLKVNLHVIIVEK